MKKLVILSGPSGSGLSTSRLAFEELGYWIVEGAPVDSISSILTSFKTRKFKTDLFCLIVGVQDAGEVTKICKDDGSFDVSLALLTTSKEALLKRYALTRHHHPRSVLTKVSLEKAIDLDLEDTNNIYPDADITIDSSCLNAKELRRELLNRFSVDEVEKGLTVTFISFGLKNGLPMALDMLFDVRNIPNPYWVETLKDLTGKDQAVIDYMMSFPQTQELLDKMVSYLEYHLKEVNAAERSSYTIGVACSGGQHRSTFAAEYLGKYFSKKYKTLVLHRDTPELNEK